MDRLDAMAVFLAAANTGSLSAAGRKLGVPLATVSRKISDLEKHLHCRLLIRGSRKLQLTEAGQNFAVAARRILDDVNEVEFNAAGEYREPRGELHISVPVTFGRTHVVPILADFLRDYRDVQIRMQQTDRAVSLQEEQVDLAVRMGKLPDSNLIAIPVGKARQVLCASPRYLDQHGTPRTLDELKDHHCIAFEAITAGGTRWQFANNGEAITADIQPRLLVNTAEAATTAAVEGIGIARVLSYQVEALARSGDLSMVLTAYEPAPFPINLVYLSERQVPLKLRAFLDFATPRLRERLGYET
jgi:DNA-binding transcriptional LysR family regulator